MREIRLWSKPLSGLDVGDKVGLELSEAHHFGNVLRGREGDIVILMDGLGREAQAQCVQKDKRSSLFAIQSLQDSPRGPELHLKGPIPKSKRFPYMLEKCQELGVASYTPLATEYSVREEYSEAERLKNVERLQDACKQSRNPWIMSLHVPQEVAPLELAPSTLVLDVGGSSIWDFPVYSGGPVQLLFGPEAGWSDTERGQFREKGQQILGLSAHHLRMETAAVLGAGFVLEWMRRG